MTVPRSATTTRTPRSPQDRQFIASLAHGIAVLEVLAAGEGEMSLSAISAQVGRSKPTVWRLLHTLVRLGYVRQDPDNRRFALSARVLSLGASFEGMDLREIAAPYLRDLSGRTSETVNMAVRDDLRIIYIERIKTSQIININLHVGSRLPIYNTSMGRALIAYLPPEELRPLLQRMRETDEEAKAFLAKGGRRLLDALTQTRERGYSLNDQELAFGLRSVGCPIWDGTQKVVAAINLSVPSARVSLRDLSSKYAPELVKTAGDISAVLGFRSRRKVS